MPLPVSATLTCGIMDLSRVLSPREPGASHLLLLCPAHLCPQEPRCGAAILHSLHGDGVYLWTCPSPPLSPQRRRPRLTPLSLSRLHRESGQARADPEHMCMPFQTPQLQKDQTWEHLANVNRPLVSPQSFLSNPGPICPATSPHQADEVFLDASVTRDTEVSSPI